MKKTYYRDVYGCTASIRENNDGSATLKVADAHGNPIYGKCYASKTAARRAMGRMSDGWKEQPSSR